jgi:metal-responsive CopG/Arc/MetJ family transcriptional regulator
MLQVWELPLITTGTESEVRNRLVAESDSGYTNGMKIAVSIPDDVYQQAERLAKQSNRSRSRLYSDALGEYLARHGSDEVTEAMNQVLAGMNQSDTFAATAARAVLAKIEW